MFGNVLSVNGDVVDSLLATLREVARMPRTEALPNLPRFDPWRSQKVARQNAKRRAEGRWDNCGDPNRKAAAIAQNASLAAEREARARRNERERLRRAAKRQQAMEAA